MEFLIAFGLGFFVTNALPHLIPGVHGKPFHSPFALPPVRGKSSAVVNVLWGFCNLVAAYLIIIFASVNLRNIHESIGFLLGVLVTSLVLAITFSRLDKEQ